jgi:hypothetical protein
MTTLTFAGVELTRDQYNLLSWLATFVYNHRILKDQISQWDIAKQQGIQSACTFAGIPDICTYEVEINLNLSGLRNYNKMTEVIYFE